MTTNNTHRDLTRQNATIVTIVIAQYIISANGLSEHQLHHYDRVTHCYERRGLEYHGFITKPFPICTSFLLQFVQVINALIHH